MDSGEEALIWEEHNKNAVAFGNLSRWENIAWK
jgi:hypothetical protein